MEIRIVLEQQHPPVGRLTTFDPQASSADRSTEPVGVTFTGWLGLLRALRDLIEPEQEEHDLLTQR